MKHYESVLKLIKIIEISICVCLTAWFLIEPLREVTDLVLDLLWIILATVSQKEANLLKKYIDESIRRNSK